MARVRRRTKAGRFMFGAVLAGAVAGCFGPPIYRPKEVKKPEIVVSAASPTAPKVRLPPEPDQKANDASVAGIDTARSGLRDDVHISIYENYSSTAKRAALMAMAKDLQSILVTSSPSPALAHQQEEAYRGALSKLRGMAGVTPDEVADMDHFLFRQTVNTPQRLESFLRYSLMLDKK